MKRYKQDKMKENKVQTDKQTERKNDNGSLEHKKVDGNESKTKKELNDA